MNVRQICACFVMMALAGLIGSFTCVVVHGSDAKAFAPPTAHREVAAQKKTPSPLDMQAIQQEMTHIFGDDAKYYSVYFLRPGIDKEPFVMENGHKSPASMIKIFVLAKGMQDVHDGKISLDKPIKIDDANVVGGAGDLTFYDIGTTRTVGELMDLMITKSDNTATNVLIDALGGMGAINEYCRTHGYKGTLLQHKMMLSNGGRPNVSTARDMGTLFTRIARSEAVGKEEDARMISSLLRQTDTECFPTALPDWSIAHKTGEITGAYHDGGIFYQGNNSFVLVILGEGWPARGEAIDKMQQAATYFAGLTLGEMNDIHEKGEEK